MRDWDVKFTDEGLADVRKLPKGVKNALRKSILATIARDPYGCSRELEEPLRGWRSFHWRKYRVVFRIYDERKIVAIGGIGERLPQSHSDVYRRLEVLAAEGRLAEKVLLTLRRFSQ